VKRSPSRIVAALAALLLAGTVGAESAADLIDRELARHPGQTGAFVLEKGGDALVARAWLSDQARESIDVQYFIWSTDNIGILAAEALLRAADRGARVRVLVDDLLMDAPGDVVLALAQHPRIDIRIYNPNLTTGVPVWRKAWNAITDFRGVNQRMHDKTFVVDGRVAITGGRNMAVEYFDFSHEYNFRDRDVLLAGAAAAEVGRSFARFWSHPLSMTIEQLFADRRIDTAKVREIYESLHTYAKAPENFAPEVRAAIDGVDEQIPAIIAAMSWGAVEFISDKPGKNDGGIAGGGRTSAALGKLLDEARERIVIESPYLVLSDRALDYFRRARDRGVRVRICTNSLASTDNLQAFSGYRNQRAELLAMGLEIFEPRPDAKIRRELMQRAVPGELPAIFSLHAKTLVVDGRTAFIGTFNLDPRSENLNTEVGAILRDAALVARVEAAMEADMQPGNSWDAARDEPDRFASFAKRAKVRLFQFLPLRPVL
jgi:putative cardiolipin synthase